MTEKEYIRRERSLEYPSYLSLRLQAVADLVSTGFRLADIGTDHAYVPIWLVQTERIPGAVAADVNRGPLMRALGHIRANGLQERIETRLSDGFSAIRPGEIQSAVLAGMGGGLIIRILKDGEQVVKSLKECILQPQSEIEKVRAFLLEEGFSFLEENMVMEEGKYYPMMKVSPPRREKEEQMKNNPNKKEVWAEEELRYGRLLLRQKNSVLREFLDREIHIKKQILFRLEHENSPRISDRKREVKKELDCAEKGLKYYALQRDYTGN